MKLERTHSFLHARLHRTHIFPFVVDVVVVINVLQFPIKYNKKNTHTHTHATKLHTVVVVVIFFVRSKWLDNNNYCV